MLRVVVGSDIVGFSSWGAWREFVANPSRGQRVSSWHSCPVCWGSGVILDPVRRPRGGIVGYVSTRCDHCLGMREVLS